MSRIKNSKLVNTRNGVLVAGAAVAAAASAWDRTHRHVSGADLTEAQMRVERLSDLRGEKQCLAAIESGLLSEWGSFAFLGFNGIEQMASEAGGTIFVVVEREADGLKARGIVQTILTNVRGAPQLLEQAYPSFGALTSRESWRRSRSHGGDTAVLLQITTLGPTERGGGLGSLLRNAVLNMLGKQVQYALTTTPIDGTKAENIDFDDASTYSAAMRFHARGGAQPSRILSGYKAPEEGTEATSHGRDIVVMRYARDEQGEWPAKRPPMRIRSLGPLQERILRTGRSLRMRGLKTPRPRLPAIRRPHVSVARLRPNAGTLRAIKSGAGRLTHRGPGPDTASEEPGQTGLTTG